MSKKFIQFGEGGFLRGFADWMLQIVNEETDRILIDNLPCPVWLRDNNLDISILNRKYLELLGLKEFKEINKDNIPHELTIEEFLPTCTENGYTTYTCSDCGDYYMGDYKDSVEHEYNKNGVCDKCGEDRTENCSCNCHKSGISKFFFKLILFFQKIFKTNKVCKCGIKHY